MKIQGLSVMFLQLKVVPLVCLVKSHDLTCLGPYSWFGHKFRIPLHSKMFCCSGGYKEFLVRNRMLVATVSNQIIDLVLFTDY